MAHIVTYSALTVLVGWAASGRRVPTSRMVAIPAVAAFLYGITEEWH